VKGVFLLTRTDPRSTYKSPVLHEERPSIRCPAMKSQFKRVPAIDKCFAVLNLLAGSERSMGISEISTALHINKSTVFNMVHTLTDLGMLELNGENKFRFGVGLYALAKVAGRSSQLIQTVHPHLEEINRKTKLSAFLGIRSDLRAVILDKVDSAFDIRMSSEIGMRLPLLAGAGGKALLSQLDDEEMDRILAGEDLRRFTARTCVTKESYKKMVRKVREEGIALDNEEYIEGIFAFAVPVRSPMNNLQAAIWAVGLKTLVPDKVIPEYSAFLKQIAAVIESRFFLD
jgi:DNA-binding IclR family transcriptional regulator